VQEAVSAVLGDRAREAEGLGRMVALSIGAHVLLVALVAMMPAGWRSRTAEEPAVMTISLGSAAGPETGGMTSIADAPVQSIARPDAPKMAETPPAPKAPEMVEPERVAKPAPKPSQVAKPDRTSRARTPTAGAEIKEGAARVRTGGAAIPFGGLASQAGGGTGGVQLDVANFCCPEYIALMTGLIRKNWNPNMGAGGQPVVKFTIRRDGVLTNIELEKSSGQSLLDLEARRAVHNTAKIPPVPREVCGSHLCVLLPVEFQRC
jgi:TonB family protein